MFKFISNTSSRLKAFVDWLDRLPGVAAFGVGVGVGVLWPVPTMTTLVVAGLVYAVIKLDLGNLGSKINEWFGS